MSNLLLILSNLILVLIVPLDPTWVHHHGVEHCPLPPKADHSSLQPHPKSAITAADHTTRTPAAAANLIRNPILIDECFVAIVPLHRHAQGRQISKLGSQPHLSVWCYLVCLS